MKVDIDLIRVGDRLRGLSEAKVVQLMDSIGDVGLLNPITVYPRSVVRAGIGVDGYGLARLDQRGFAGDARHAEPDRARNNGPPRPIGQLVAGIAGNAQH